MIKILISSNCHSYSRLHSGYSAQFIFFSAFGAVESIAHIRDYVAGVLIYWGWQQCSEHSTFDYNSTHNKIHICYMNVCISYYILIFRAYDVLFSKPLYILFSVYTIHISFNRLKMMHVIYWKIE